MRSFLQSDSTYRASKGGKGVGRFSWLKAFERAEVESIFREDGVYVTRKFEFSVDKVEVDDRLDENKEASDNCTIIKLINYKPEYRKHAFKQADTIATKIMQHCLIYLMSSKCPQISVFDEGLRISINDMFERSVKNDQNIDDINIIDKTFSLVNIRVEDLSLNGNKLYLCANDRMVKEIDLNKAITDLDKNIFTEKGFYYVGILTGDYLDKNVDMNRTSFNIVESKTENEVSMEDIIEQVKIRVENFLYDYLSDVRSKKEERIKKYISTSAPQFTHLLKYMHESIKAIKPNLGDDRLDEELYKIKRKFDIELKAENLEIIKKIDVGSENLDEYQIKFKTQFEKISEANKAALAEYVAHRKIILDLLKKGIRLKDDSKFNKEAYIHNLIYPMHRTSDEIEYKSHNLWLIDERLAYCDYISSDIPFNNDNKEERTDILVLDNPVAVSDEENSGREYESVVIFELKRPMRDNYNISDNPIQQLLGYVDKLMTNKMSDKEGRTIHIGQNTQFYLYAICDLTSNLRKVAEYHDFLETPDKMGLYKYHDKKRAYIEIISYDKLTNDAEKRNKILFDKLGL